MSDLQVQSTLKHKREEIKWRTAEGRLTSSLKMDTSHLFNIVKMYYNHLAHLTNMPTYGFTKIHQDKYDAWKEKPQRTAYILKQMILELEDRTDWGDRGYGLGEWQLETYKSIRESIKRGVPFETIKQLKENNE